MGVSLDAGGALRHNVERTVTTSASTCRVDFHRNRKILASVSAKGVLNPVAYETKELLLCPAGTKQHERRYGHLSIRVRPELMGQMSTFRKFKG
jgi:hypothetical protein